MEAKIKTINNLQTEMLPKITSLVNPTFMDRTTIKEIRTRNPVNPKTIATIVSILKAIKEMTIWITFKANLFMENNKVETINITISLIRQIVTEKAHMENAEKNQGSANRDD